MRKIKISIHWIILFICVITSLSIFIFTFSYSTNIIKNSNKDKIDVEYKYLTNNIESFDNERKAYISILANHTTIINYLINKDISSKNKVLRIFKDQMNKLNLIMQLRILTLDGKELIKLDKKDGKIILVKKDELQNKSDREYFKKFMLLNKDEMGISSLDLNVENGKLDIPFRATLRIAMPIFNKKEKIGIVIINYAMNDWLKENIKSSFLNVNLVDKDGYFIINDDKNKNWSKYRSDKYTIKDEFNISIKELNSYIYDTLNNHNFIVKDLELWNNDLFYIIYNFKNLEDTNLFINQSKTIGISIILALLILILPFLKLLFEYINRLKSSEFKINKILDNSLDSIVLINQKGIIQTVNNTTLKTFGYEESELIGQNVNILIPEPHHSKHDSYLASHDKMMMTKVLTMQRELFGIDKNKKLIPISLSVTKVNISNETFFIGSIRDIQSERENKKLFENVFDESPLGIALVLPDGTFWRLNNKFSSIIGYTNEEAVNLSFKDITHKDDLEKDLSNINKLITKEIDRYSIEKRYIHKNGDIIWINLYVTSVFLDEKKIEYFIFVIEDITFIKELQEKDKNQEHLLMQQAKLVSMGEMVAAIAHQWRQPLNSIGLATQDLISAYKHGEIDEEYLLESKDEIMGQLKYMSTTVDEFRNFFTKSNKIVKFNLIDALKEVISFYWAQLKQNSITIDIYIYHENKKFNIKELPAFDFNEYDLSSRVSELKQLIINCISNSKDAIVQLEDSDNINRKIDITVLKKEDNFFEIIITDYAGGIKPEVRDRIFEPYFTTKEIGTGLGLYISKMVMNKSLKGDILYSDSEYNYEDKKYKGSSFILKISSIN
jgi:PAS domain S-box-containing protein|tara:strand:+ start:12036 stop:14552 length:2517 start_codon:yes stop_codon:yes gene_type:complete